MQRFTDLKVWQRAHPWVLAIYRQTQSFPADERFGMTSQLRRAAVSVAANIAEGTRRKHPQDYARFLNIAESSIAEAECLLLLSRDLGYLKAKEQAVLGTEADEISRMILALRQRVEEQ